jgi:hypothetical protein
VDCPEGFLKVEILDQNGTVITPFSIENCIPVSEDSTIYRIRWKRSDDLSAIKGRVIRFRFHLENGHLYSFWVSPEENGASHGYVAAGGPGYICATDDKGLLAYKEASTYAI